MRKRQRIAESPSSAATHSLPGAAVLLAVFLSVPFVARGDGLPGEYVVTQRWRDLFAYRSPLSNPAFMQEENYTSFRGVFSNSIGNLARLWEMGLSHPLGLYHTLGLTWISEDDGELTTGTFNGPDYVLSDTTLHNQNSLFALSYAHNPWRSLTLGVNAHFIHHTNFGDPFTGVGLDAGFTWRLLQHHLLGYHLVGASYQNAISHMLEEEMEGYSSQIRASHLARLLNNRLISHLMVDITDFSADPEDFLNGTPSVEWDMTWSLGVQLLRMLDIHWLMGFDKVGVEYIGGAGGVNIPHVNNGRDASVMYQFRTEPASSSYPSHSLYLRFDMGRHREQLAVKRLSRTVGLSPDKLYNKAMRLYHEEKYWDAFFIFRQILALHPDFFKNDWVLYYSGRCQEKMDMRAAGLWTMERTVATYPSSPAVPHADLATMRIRYRNQEHTAVADMFSRITQSSAAGDSIKHHAHYIMGETFMRQGEQRKAIQAFSRIPWDHPIYLFAQHSKGIAHIVDLELDKAISAFENVIEGNPTSPQQKEIVNRTYLFLGYLFYEKMALNQTVAALRRVPEDSYYYAEAQLGLAWSAVLARQWADCIDAATNLHQHTRRPILLAESLLLQAYGLMMKKDYGSAQQLLAAAEKALENYRHPTQAELLEILADERQIRWNYDDLARSVDEIAGQRLPGQNSTPRIDSLHNRQKSLSDSLSASIRQADEYERTLLFGRNAQKIIDDVSYAAAIVAKIAESQDVNRAVRKMNREQESIDQQIEKLQREMEQLEEDGQ